MPDRDIFVSPIYIPSWKTLISTTKALVPNSPTTSCQSTVFQKVCFWKPFHEVLLFNVHVIMPHNEILSLQYGVTKNWRPLCQLVEFTYILIPVEHKMTIIYYSDICMHQNGTMPKQTTKTTNDSTLYEGFGRIIYREKTLCILYAWKSTKKTIEREIQTLKMHT